MFLDLKTLPLPPQIACGSVFRLKNTATPATNRCGSVFKSKNTATRHSPLPSPLPADLSRTGRCPPALPFPSVIVPWCLFSKIRAPYPSTSYS